jgi:hypothetical protein
VRLLLVPETEKKIESLPIDYVGGIQANATGHLRAITKSDYQRCFRQRQESWNKYVQAQGHYFEEDKAN